MRPTYFWIIFSIKIFRLRYIQLGWIQRRVEKRALTTVCDETGVYSSSIVSPSSYKKSCSPPHTQFYCAGPRLYAHATPTASTGAIQARDSEKKYIIDDGRMLIWLWRLVKRCCKNHLKKQLKNLTASLNLGSIPLVELVGNKICFLNKY